MGFLKVEWKKFILPILLILVFFITIYFSYSSVSALNEYGCEIASLIQEQQINTRQNNTLAINQTAKKMLSISENLRENTRKTKIAIPIFIFMKSINPLVPLPCEILGGNFCRFYMSEKTYNCLNEMDYGGMDNFLKMTLPEYKRLSIFYFFLNILFLFIEGYLISCLILFIYRKFVKSPEIVLPNK